MDKYQGQQNDYILLSLVRTHNIGHLRDVRRLVVAMSRARLGLYVFARVNLFKNCFELTPAFNLLCSRPVDGLHLCPNEVYPTSRQANVTAPNPLVIRVSSYFQFLHWNSMKYACNSIPKKLNFCVKNRNKYFFYFSYIF